MSGFPANRLETYVNMLLDRGFDVEEHIAAENTLPPDERFFVIETDEDVYKRQG